MTGLDSQKFLLVLLFNEKKIHDAPRYLINF